MLTPKQQAFVAEYLIDFNATAAYKRAGYQCKTDEAARANSSRLLTNDNVAKAIQEAMSHRALRCEITADRVLKEIAYNAFADIGDVLDFSGDDVRLKKAYTITEAGRRALSSMKVKRYWEGKGDDAREVEVVEFKQNSKEGSLRDLAKHLGILKDTVEITGKDGAAILIRKMNVKAADEDSNGK